MKKVLARMMAFLAAIIVFASCSKSSDSPSSPTDSGNYPKSVDIEYRVTKLSGGNLTTGNIIMIDPKENATPGPQSLPFSKKKTIPDIKKYDALSCSFSSSSFIGDGSVRLEILVNGKVVATKDASGTSFVYADVVYIFP